MNSLRWIVGIIFVVAFATTSSAQTVSGVMMVVKGDIKVTGKDGKTEAAKVGKKVAAGDTIVSGPDSRAKIVMADKNVINISPDSKITIEKYENDGKERKNVELNVVYGKLRASVEQKYDGEKSKFNVKTPSAVAGVRGTDFITGYNPSTRSAQIITFQGSVAVGSPGPGGSIQNPVFVQAGQMTTAGAGKPPEAPKAVPQDDLNKMNNESKAEAAPAAKQDSSQASTDAQEKKEEKKEAQEEKKEAKNEVKEEKKEAKEEKKDAKKEAQAEKKEVKEEKKNAKKEAQTEKKNSRAPASTGGGESSGTAAAPADSGGTATTTTGGTATETAQSAPTGGTTTTGSTTGTATNSTPPTTPSPAPALCTGCLPPPPPPPPTSITCSTCNMFTPPPPTTTYLPPPPVVDPTILNQKSAVTIQLQP